MNTPQPQSPLIHTTLYDTNKILGEIARQERHWSEKIQVASLCELLAYEASLTLTNDLQRQNPDVVNASVVLHQTIIRVALLWLRDGILMKIQARIRYLRRRSGYPTHSMIEDRYEDCGYHPPHYPDWSEKKWAGIFHRIRKIERENRHTKRIQELSDERREEEEKIEKEQALSRLCATLKEIGREHMEGLIDLQIHVRIRVSEQVTARNQSDLNSLILDGFYGYVGAFSESELYFALDYNMNERRAAEKSDRKFYDAIIKSIQNELTLRGLSFSSRNTIQQGHTSMSEAERIQFIEQKL